MLNQTEADERRYLEEVKKKLAAALRDMGRRVDRYSQDVREQKAYIWEHKGDMDHVEKISAREAAEQLMRSGEVAVAAKLRLEKLLQSPYFGRLDFSRSGGTNGDFPVYIGIHSFMDQAKQRSIIFDWRAPISALFYDFELGAAKYLSPSGEVSGEIKLKRQFRISQGKMDFMLESGLNIRDDVLQEELSRSSDDRMKSIVATIQRDQNAIIRNEDAEVLIIQGVAGSGKTSIALHRIAYLLYRFKDRLSSKDILIISPNKVFASFIANVLPELGEEQIAELEMEELAAELLGGKYKFQTYLEQAAKLLAGNNAGLTQRIQAKATPEFLDQLDRYAVHIEAARFRAVDLPVVDQVIPVAFLVESFQRSSAVALSGRLRWVAECVEQQAWVKWRYELSRRERAALRAAIGKMGRKAALKTLYREFFTWLGRPELFKSARGGVLEYSDVFPLIYLKLCLEGAPNIFKHVKHLVVDEMQDYTPVQYGVLAQLFLCDKTILGDVNQSLNAWTASTAAAISRQFPNSQCVKLCQSYRSSYEITRFAQGISPNPDLVAIERRGKKPQVQRCRDEREERTAILRQISLFSEQKFQTMGIICRTPGQAEKLYETIRNEAPGLHLLSAGSTAFVRGVVVCSVHLAKGLEFDRVLVPQATAKNYAAALDKNLLYVACTRAMHELLITHAGPLTSFIADKSFYEVL